ncbi:MAG: ribosomal-protein-alanine N-acetyltransferase [Chloroflexi bacterium]|nr:ribosomal-protein-alanine N-acetyltransferase [Chloroflexota bacterium]
MNNTLRLRPMTLDDVPGVVELDRLSFSLPWPERSFRFEVAENDASRCWVAEMDAGGRTHLVAMLVLWLVEGEAHIATLAVRPEFRRQGVGQAILQQTLQAAQAEGARSAMLEVRSGNLAAQELYRKYGFQVVGTRPHYYKDNNEDAILLTLDTLESI